MDTGLKSASVANLSKQNVVSGKDGSKNNFSSSISLSRYGNSDMIGGANQVPATEHSLYHPHTSCYGYCYPGYDGSYPEWDDRHYFHAQSCGLLISFTVVMVSRTKNFLHH
ncbi:hypothetical protein MKX01_027586 [Papaver californicum]|nr:hypothetical protein MKX01_027586 [Papaver californicum]